MAKVSTYIICLSIVLLSVPAFAQKDITKTIYSERERVERADRLLHGVGEGAQQLDSIRIAMRDMFQKGAYNDVVDVARRIRNEAEATSNERLLMTSALYMGQAYGYLAISDSSDLYINEALGYATRFKDYFTIAAAYNSLGIQSVINETDYNKGLRYYHQALEATDHLSDGDDFHLAIKTNLAYAYYYRNDSAGLKYAQEVYTAGKKAGDNFRIYNGGFTSAYMYYLLGDYTAALQYINETFEIIDDYYGHTHVYTLYGDILSALGDKTAARESYLKAFEYYYETEAYILVDTFLSFGRFLVEEGDVDAAIFVLEQGIDFTIENNIVINRHKLYESLSHAYRELGDHTKALEYYTLYHDQASNLFNIEREGSLNELRIAYETERKEKELRDKEEQIAKERRKQNRLIFVLVLILAVLLLVFIYFRRKNRMYLQIVKDYRDLKLKEAEAIPGLPAEPAGHSDGNAEHDEGAGELFRTLEEKMASERLYRDNELTADKLASIMGTNRPYLSKVINGCSGKNYNGYINSYRVKDAVGVLSDANDDTPLKALAQELGFNSLSVFYSAFKDAIGVSPSRFRENWRKIDREESSGKPQ